MSWALKIFKLFLSTVTDLTSDEEGSIVTYHKQLGKGVSSEEANQIASITVLEGTAS